MDRDEFKCQVMIDRTLIGNKYMNYIASIKEPDLVSKICIQIPAFCDPMLLSTIESFRKNAANPDRLTFAVCFQDDDMNVLKELQSIPNCKVKHFPKIEAPGLCAARYECNKLVDDEPYVMHTDSHMRAAKYWDVALIDMWKSCRDEKAIISSYPLDYTVYQDCEPDDIIFTENVKDYSSSIGVPSNFNIDGTIRFRGLAMHEEPKNHRGLFISGGFVFAKAILDKECPSDPDMFFVADEIARDVRYYTYGYNVYHPAYMPIWHLYGQRKTADQKPVERFNTKADDYNLKRNTEELRIRSLSGLIKDPVDLGEFGLGKERSLDSFLEISGIDFAHHAVRGFAKSGHFFMDSDKRPESDNKWYYYEMSDAPIEQREHICDDIELDEDGDHSRETICVQIPAYKDPQIIRTVESLMYQADYPERVHIVICLQDDDESIINSLTSMANVRFKQVNPSKARGTGTARRACQLMYHHEDYVLITDAHMLAIKHWDTMLIRQLLNIHDSKAVISAQAPDFGPCRGKDFRCGCFDMPYPGNAFGINGFMKSMGNVPSLLYNNHYVGFLKDKWRNSRDFDVFVRGFGITGGYTFTYGIFNEQVPYSKSAVYRGDECITSVVAFTKGFHVYTYMNSYLLHDSVTTRLPLTMPLEKYKQEQQVMYDLVMQGQAADVSLGKERKIDDLTKYLGVDFRNQIIYKRAYTCEPGTSDTNIESIGSKMYRKNAYMRLTKKIHVIVGFSDQTAWEDCVTLENQHIEFQRSILDAAYRPENVIIHPFDIQDGKTYGYHVNHIVAGLDASDDDILLFVDGAVRFLAGWDNALIQTFDGLNPYTVWSTNTYANRMDKAYNNPAIQVEYDTNKPEVTVITLSEASTCHMKPVILRGVVSMRLSAYREVPFDPNLCYADHSDTYHLRLYTHGYDIYYDELSRMYRNHIVSYLDDIKTSDAHIKACLMGSVYEDFDEDWSNYPYGHGQKRSLVGWYRQLGFIDTNRKACGIAKF